MGNDPTLSRAQAEALTREISTAIARLEDDLDRTLGLIEQAVQGGAHVALGYTTISAYLRSEFGGALDRLDATSRRPIVVRLYDIGLGVRDIGELVGTSGPTSSRDLANSAGVSSETPVTVGRDGKSYSRTVLLPTASEVSDTGRLPPATSTKDVRRRPDLPPLYRKAVQDLWRLVQKMQDYHRDDRFARNRPDLKHSAGLMKELGNALLGLADELEPDDAHEPAEGLEGGHVDKSSAACPGEHI